MSTMQTFVSRTACFGGQPTVLCCQTKQRLWTTTQHVASPRLHCQPGRHSTSRASVRRSTVLVAGGGAAAWLVAGGLVAAGAAAASGLFGGDNPQMLVRSGMNKFRQNDVEGSVEDFDKALLLSPQLNPYLWQRGLSLYYLEQYKAGAKQFRDDVAVNPNDTEESIWAFLCEAQLEGPEAARQNMLQVGRDPRPVMRAAYDCFKSGSSPDAILAAARDDGGHDSFYALLYVGLWHEAHGNAAAAQEAVTQAVATQYAQLSGDYMASLAKVHCQRRGWRV